jgi:predicted permease
MISLRLAARTLFKTPFVTAVTIASLALGIGANAAIYSMFNQLLLRPLPVRDPARLVNVGNPGPKPGSQSCGRAGSCDVVFSYPMFRDLERAPSALSGLAAHVLFGANLAYRGQTLSGEGVMVSGSYFPVLGVRPARGRLFTPDDDRTVGAHFVAVLSHSFWETRLGSDPAAVGATIVVNGQSMTILGIAPRGFEGTTLGARPQVYVPISMRGLMNPGFTGFDNRRSYWAYVFGRLKPGVTLTEAQGALNAVYRPLINDVEAPLQQGMSDQTMARFRAREIVLEDGRRGQSSVRGEARTPLILLFSITGIVLLIACANIANLLLARGANRSLEMAVRLSLGAGRRQILSQLLTESLLLAVLGGAVSLVVARWTMSAISSMLPPDASSAMVFQLDATAVAFAAGLSIATGFLFGLFPALHSTRTDLITAVRANTGQPSGARAASRFRTSLVTAQIALSMTLLMLAGLFVKSLMNVSRIDLGVRIDNVVTFGISPELNGYDAPRAQALFARVEEALRALPGVTSVSAATVPILAGNNWGNSVGVEGFQSGPDTDTHSMFNEIGPDYFRTLGVTLLSGRDFTLADAGGRPNVAIVNQAFARKFNLGGTPVGKRMSVGRNETLDIEIVGLVPDTRYSEVKRDVPPLYFRPWRQDANLGSIQFYVRTRTDPRPFLRTIPPVITRLDPNLPVEELKTMPQQVRENVFLDRMISTLSASFALLATLLAAVGLYGVLAYTVAQRTREIGVRMALGADGRRVRRMVLRQVAVMTLIGGVIGIGAAIGLGKLAGSLLFGLQGHDPLVMLVSAAILTLVAFGAGEIPALRASRVDPMQALRYE